MSSTRASLLKTCLATIAALCLFAGPAFSADVQHATARYRAGSGLYLTGVNKTDGLRKVQGWVTASQAGAGATITVRGTVRHLRANTLYVAVPYKDGICLPVPGVTAFPSGSFRTNRYGNASIPVGTTVNPRAINPRGEVNVTDAHSMSIRRVVLTPVPLPALPGYPNGVPAGTPIVPAATPTVPNVAAVEACDRTLELH